MKMYNWPVDLTPRELAKLHTFLGKAWWLQVGSSFSKNIIISKSSLPVFFPSTVITTKEDENKQ